MAARKLVCSMSIEELEFKRFNDRINQQHSRVRKRRKLDELQATNRRLTAELDVLKEELQGYKRREDAVRNALDWLSTIIDKPSATTNHVEDTTSNQPQKREWLDIQPHDTTTDSSLPTSSDAASEQLNYEFLDISSTFDSLNGGCVLNLPGEFGDGAWVNLLSPQTWQTHMPMDCCDLEGSSALSSEIPQALNEASMAQCLPFQSRKSQFDIEPTTASASETGFTQQPISAKPAWQVLPLNIDATNELDKVLLEVTALGRQWKSRQGDYHSELSHPSFPSISSLLNRDLEDEQTNNPLAAALGRYTVTTPVVNFPRKVAFHYTVAHLLRWLVNPTEESFNHLPQFLRPTIVQQTVPHPAWIDTVPWPQARDRIIQNYDIFDYEVFKRVTKLSSINWSYPHRDIFLSKQGSKQLVLSPQFVAHISNLNNWTNGPELALAFPFLRGWPTTPPRDDYQWPD